MSKRWFLCDASAFPLDIDALDIHYGEVDSENFSYDTPQELLRALIKKLEEISDFVEYKL